MSFYTAPYSQPYSSNRGMTNYPEQTYQQNVAYYTPQQPKVGGGRVVNRDGSPGPAAGGGGGNSLGGLDFSQFFQTNLNGGGNGQQAAFDPRQLAGREKLEYRRQMAQGNSPFRSRTGGSYAGGSYPVGGGAPATGIPPATTNPQTPTGGNGLNQLMSQLAQVNSGITAGAMPQNAMQNAMAQFQSLMGGQGGSMGSMMAQYGNRAGLDLERGMTQQGAQMDLTAQQARSQGNLDKMNLLYNNERETVMNDVAMRNLLVNLFSGLAGGFA